MSNEWFDGSGDDATTEHNVEVVDGGEVFTPASDAEFFVDDDFGGDEFGTDVVPHDEVTGIVDMTVPLNTEEARELTEHIRSAVDVVWMLVARAHAGRAWEALGYPSFAAYVKEEFDISRSRAYQLLDQAKVVQAIESATPEDTNVVISEAAARDLKSVLGEFTEEVSERTAGLPADEAADMVDEIVEDYREKVRERREEERIAAEDAAAERAERGDRSDLGEWDGPADYTPPPPPSLYGEDDDLDPAVIRRNVQACYDLYSSLQALKGMPDIEDIIATIPAERRVQINDSLGTAVDWLVEFRTSWYAQPWQGEEAGDDEDYDEGDDFGDEDDDHYGG